MAHKGSMRSAASRSFEMTTTKMAQCDNRKTVGGNDFSPRVGQPQLSRFAELNEVVEIQGAN